MEHVDNFKSEEEFDFQFFFYAIISILSLITILIIEYTSIFSLTDWSFFGIPLLFSLLIIIENRWLKKAFLLNKSTSQ
jgi:hypothetical protein